MNSVFRISELQILRNAQRSKVFVNKFGERYKSFRKKARLLHKRGLLELVTELEDGFVYTITDDGRSRLLTDEIKQVIRAIERLDAEL